MFPVMHYDPKDKPKMIEAMLEKGMVTIYVDNKTPGAVLPQYLAGEERVVLNLSWRFRLPMRLTESHLIAVLTFQGKNFECQIPWNRIWCARDVNGEAILFVDSFPPSFFEQKKDQSAAEVIHEQPLTQEQEIQLKIHHNANPERSAPRKGHLRLLH